MKQEKNINIKVKLLSLATGAMFATVITCQNAQANTIDFASTPGASGVAGAGTAGGVSFNGAGGFSFVNASANDGPYSGYSFFVNGSDMPVGDSIGDLGTISGAYTIGSITSSGGTETASVGGSGTLSIWDGSDFLTGTISWDDITTSGTTTTLNITGQFNVTSVTYLGAQVDLQTLAASGILSDTVSFTINAGQDLEYLAGNAVTTTYSGSVAAPVPDGGMTAELLGATLLAIAAIRRKMAC